MEAAPVAPHFKNSRAAELARLVATGSNAMQTSQIESALSPDAFLAALAARGREWRESALPTPVQAVGAYAIRVRIRGTNFEVQLVGSPNRVTPRCIGRISPTASGSQILVRMGSSRGTRVSYALAVVWLSFLSYQAGSLFAMMLVLGAATLGAGTLSHWTFAEAEREALFMLVAEIAATPVTGQRANLNASLPNDRCG